MGDKWSRGSSQYYGDPLRSTPAEAGPGLPSARLFGQAAERMAELQRLLREALEADLMDADMYLDEAKKLARSLHRLASRRDPDVPQFLRVYAEAARFLTILVDYMLTLRFATEAGQLVDRLAAPERELEEAKAVFDAINTAIDEHLGFVLDLYREAATERSGAD